MVYGFLFPRFKKLRRKGRLADWLWVYERLNYPKTVKNIAAAAEGRGGGGERKKLKRGEELRERKKS